MNRLLVFLFFVLCTTSTFGQLNYRCGQTFGIQIDGKLDKNWDRAEYTALFVDIEGDKKPLPHYQTKVKMLWDKDYLYIYAQLQDPHIWANLRQRDTVIFYDNDFEVFIDPDGDGLNYYEIEINALNTVWDLKLDKAYSKGGKADNSWNIEGLRSAISIQGSLNKATDIDTAWHVEMAIPWTSFAEGAPKLGDTWRINFSRVQWDTDIVKGAYVKRKNKKTGKNLPERNWVWSPQGKINMHIPEKWGYLEFAK